MFPAYRSEEVQRHAPAGRDEPQESGQRGIVTASVVPAATTSSYGSFKWTSAKESTTSGKVDEKYKRMKKQLQKEKKRREREELKRRELSKHSIKVVSLFSSDDDESGAEEEIMLEPMKITTKHKHPEKDSRKHGKRRKHRKSRRSSRSRSRSRSSKKSRRRSRSRSRSESESSSSASYQSSSSSTARNSSSSNHSSNRRIKTDLELANAKALNNMKWSFMEKMIPNQPSTFYVLDRKLDRANSMYDSAYRYEVSKFTINTRQILGGNEQLNRAVFAQELAAAAKKREKRAVRYFDEAVRRTWSEQPERYWRSIETKVDMDVIPLSTEPLDVSELPEREQVKNVLLDESVMEGLDLEKRSQKLNELLGRGENRKNIDLWFKFLAVQGFDKETKMCTEKKINCICSEQKWVRVIVVEDGTSV
ncbi:unnamed protein product [Anisakis simplex]|uniref:DUF4187 domain-containing protein n=1 Tax=Anisakis simplex TaxID=6269 RepID=A0A0M3J0K9_ANISI|nr:unnamed protein product [Anisakis simplex]